jgi:hypothetical protein
VAIPNKEKIPAVSPIAWRAAEYEFVEKGERWYFVVGGVALALFALALWQKNFFFAVFIALATVAVFVYSRRRPRVMDFVIDEHGVHVGAIDYSYDSIEAFAFHARPGRLDHLVLQRTTPMNPFIHIPIDSQLAEKARVVLEQKLPEFEFQAVFVESLADWLGF